jgi:sterol desaturase/sphingolipid hydroxylase (fatty acid hydroxylase superfamily)
MMTQKLISANQISELTEAASQNLLVSPSIGIAVTSGAIAFAGFASIAHQIQHNNPDKCFWMKMPIHYVHHQNNQWDSNFGLTVDYWDRVFKTYKPIELIFEKQ